MAFSAIGNYQFLSQMYYYKEKHRIACSFKVLPTVVALYEPEPINDYHWMDAGRWAGIERALWRLLDNLERWQDAKKIRVQLVVDHINVRIRASETPHPSLQYLFGALVPEDDLYLSIKLQYIPCEDSVVLKALDSDINVSAKSIISSSNAGRVKPKAAIQEKPSQSKPKYKQYAKKKDDDDEDWLPTTSGRASSNKSTRVRRTVSQGGYLNNEGTSGKLVTRSMSVSRTSSVAARLHDQFSKAGDNLEEKPISFSALKKLNEKPSTSSSAKTPKEQSGALKRKRSNGARLDKPRETRTLLLENLGQAEVLGTFERYKHHFDKLFNERKSMKETLNYMNISHMDVMGILSVSIRDKMMKKLGEVYYYHSNHTSLVINGLLPLWIVLLFADTHKLSQRAALRKIKNHHKESYFPDDDEENDPLGFDLDDD